MSTHSPAVTRLSFLVCFLTLVALSCPATAAPALRNGLYIIQMADSDMTVAATSERNNSPMILWPYRPTATWIFTHLGGNIYSVRTNATMLDGANARPGSPVTITSYKSQRVKDGQRWALKRVGQFYQFINVDTGLAMELNKGHRIKGSVLHASTPSDSRDQLFCIQKPRDPKYCGNGKKAPKQGRNQQRDDIFDTEGNFAR